MSDGRTSTAITRHRRHQTTARMKCTLPIALGESYSSEPNHAKMVAQCRFFYRSQIGEALAQLAFSFQTTRCVSYVMFGITFVRLTAMIFVLFRHG